MIGIWHKFTSINEKEIKKHEGILYNNFTKNFKTIKIHDDIIVFMLNTLNWIKTKNYKIKKLSYGLNYYGISIIYPDQLLVLENIIKGWINLFNNAPEIFHPDLYNKISINMKKDDVIKELKELIIFIKEAIDENNCIIHFGI